MKVSIVIPAYNEEAYIERCLTSLNAQTVLADEIIVVDNNSSDRTAEIASGFTGVKVIPEPKQGIVYARNAGLNAATGDVIARLDADTRLPKDWVAEIRSDFESHLGKIYGITGTCYFYDLPFRKLLRLVHKRIYYDISRLLFGHEVFFGSNMAMTKIGWEKVKDEVCLTNEIHEDVDLAIHFAKYGTIELDTSLIVEVSGRGAKQSFSDIKRRFVMWLGAKKYHKNLALKSEK